MVADVGDPAVALFMDRGLIGTPALQVAVADEIHVLHFRLLLSCGGQSESRDHPPQHQYGDPCFTRATLARHKLSFSESAANRRWRGARLQNLSPNSTKSLFVFSCVCWLTGG